MSSKKAHFNTAIIRSHSELSNTAGCILGSSIYFVDFTRTIGNKNTNTNLKSNKKMEEEDEEEDDAKKTNKRHDIFCYYVTNIRIKIGKIPYFSWLHNYFN